jgi:hypothetical protein
MQPIFISRRSAAKYMREAWGMRCSEKWLAKLVVTGGGPQFWKSGRSVLYRRDALDVWAIQRIKGPWASSSELGSESTAAISYRRFKERMPFEEA